MNTKYAYPAKFIKEGEQYCVEFPDIPNCVTFGNSVEEAIRMAEDALCLMLYDMEERGKEIPPASNVSDVCKEQTADVFATMVRCDTLEYRRYFNSKAVKKTLTIPAWLNSLAEKEDINFSYVLQNALKKTLGIETNT